MYLFKSLSLNENFEFEGLDLTYPEQGLGDTASAYYAIPAPFLTAAPKPIFPLFAVITGTAGNDVLNGTADADTIDGLAGDDVINGLGGNDQINGGVGADTVDAGDGDDIITDTEFAAPSDNDVYDGGAGNDTLIYTALLGGSEITFNLATGQQTLSGGTLIRDTFTNIENLTLAGTVNAIGDANDNILTATGSAVNIFEGGGGADTLDGGAGNDTLSYAGSAAGVTINLGAGTASGGDATGDVFSNFENILGSAFADNLTGDLNDNTIDGGAGDDSISGGGGTEQLLGGDGNDIIFSSGIGSQFSTLSGGSGNDTLFIGGDMLNGDSADGGAGIDVITFSTNYTASYLIDGGADSDLLSADNQTAALEIDLAAGRMNFVGSSDFLSESSIVNIENIRGGTGNDILTGDANDNQIEGDQGDDIIDGGAGNDTAVYLYATSAVNVSLNILGVGQNTGGAGTDTLISIENLTGSDFNDNLIGSVQDNILSGFLGDDILDGGVGDDTLQGDQGSDTAAFTLATLGVTVDLNIQGVAQNTWGMDMDTLISIENILGSAHDDDITGDAGDNVLSGAGGNDLIEGGAGADVIDGGSGIDTVSYAGSADAVFLGLGGVGFSGDAEGDVVSNVENIVGSAFDDSLTGDANDNVLDGGDGGDNLTGADGNDTLNGEDGNDFLRGDLGADILNGGIGSDSLEGGDGNDILNGGDGNDSLEGGLGLDVLTGGAGCDGFIFDMYADSGVGANADVITDFALGDTIRVSEYLGVSRDAFINEILTFLGTGAFTSAGSPEFRYEKIGGQTLIQMDSNGDGIADSEIIIQSGEFDLRLTNDGVPRLEVDSALTVSSPDGDKVIGTNGNDVLIGSAMDDSLRGLAGDDTIDAGAGDDFISGGSGNDIVDGGDGVDQITYFGDAPVNLTITDSSVFDAVSGETDTLSNIERITHSQRLAAPSDDTMDASAATVFVGLYGGRGNDILIGGSNDDIIEGDIGTDTLTGGLGADRFTFDFVEEIQNDVITDFEVGDIIDFASIQFVEMVNLTWLDTAAFTGLAGEFRSVASGGQTVFEFDFDGDTIADQFITLLGGEFTFVDLQPGLQRFSILTEAATSGDDTIVGTNGDDILDGLAGNDAIQGLAGDDIITGGEGADAMDGGAGSDTLSYAGSAAAVNANLNLGTFAGGDATGDSAVNFENLIGSGFDDILIGDAGDNVIEGGAGADTMDAGAGIDTLSYAGSAAGVTIDLNVGGFLGGDAAGDTASNFENLEGSEFNDSLIGDALSNSLSGLGGNDILNGGDGNDALSGGDGDDSLLGGTGADVLDGGSGLDTADYSNSAESVFVDLLNETASNGDADGDVLTNIENLAGSAFDDTLIGDDNANTISGGDGGDFMRGNAGDDLIEGGAGNDFLRGDDGADTLNGDAGDDDLEGGAGADFLNGGDGDDSLNGGAGLDVLSGGAGCDIFVFDMYADSGVGMNADVITDFALGDRVSVSEYLTVPRDPNVGELLTFIGTGAFTMGGSPELRYEKIGGQTLIQMDSDGDGNVDSEVIIQSGEFDLRLTGEATPTLEVDAAFGTTTAGDDKLVGTAGNDTLIGGDGNDSLRGLGGDDIIDAGAGDDFINGGLGNDTIDGGDGFDSYQRFALNQVNLTITDGSIIDSISGETDLISNVEQLSITQRLAIPADDIMDASAATIITNLFGGRGNDILIGGSNDDNIEGDSGTDTMTGGAGADRFTFDRVEEIDNDLITDLEVGDTVEFTFIEFNEGVDLTWLDTGVFTGLAGEYRYETSGGQTTFQFDIDGDTVADRFVTITNGEFTLFETQPGLHRFGIVDPGGPTPMDDVLFGTNGDDVIDLLAGNDIYDGFAGDDIIDGNEGNDSLGGGDGDDIFIAGLGDDTIDGDAGLDIISFVNATASINVFTLDDGTTIDATGQGLGTETFTSIEGIIGSDFDDFIFMSSFSTDTRSMYFDGGAGDDFLRTGAGDDELHGGAGDDSIRGGAGDDMLFGGDGDDHIRSDAGVDTIDGGAGLEDRISFFNLDATQGAVADLRTGITTNDGFGNMETFTNIEGLGAGTAFADLFDGDDNDNILLGAGFGDTINAHAGDDNVQVDSGGTYDGGAGIDSFRMIGGDRLIVDTDSDGFAEFESQTTGVTIDLQSGIISEDGYGGTGTAVNFENVFGGTFNDTLFGTSGANEMGGGDGNDFIDGRDGDDMLTGGLGDDILIGGAGADMIDGSDGVDLASYTASSAGVNINLAAGTASGGDAAGDILTNIEDLTGSSFADTLIGDANANNLFGEAGNDIIQTGAGIDTVEAGAGDDLIIWDGTNGDFEAGESYDGGDGNDTISVTGNTFFGAWNPIPATILINLATGEIRDITDTTVLATAVNFENYDGSATTSGVEVIVGTAGDNILTTAASSQAFLFGLDGNDSLTTGVGNDQITGGEGADIMDGGAGIDELSYDNAASTASTGVSVNLAAGTASGGDAQGDVFSNFENLRGSDFDDILTGDANANIIFGGGGNDTISLGGGDDTANGGDGNDVVFGGGGADILNGDDGDDTLNGEADNDTLNGGIGNDLLFGGDGDDSLNGGAGDDLLNGGTGADLIDGGDGFDTVDYSFSGSGVTINLAAGTVTGGDATGDVISNVEAFIGSTFNDTIEGDTSVNNILGGTGDDALLGGLGDDYIEGGAGADLMHGEDGTIGAAGVDSDTLGYRESDARVIVSLIAGTASGGHAEGDVFSEFENVEGSNFNDILTGDNLDNIITGNGGNDRLIGLDGDDTLIGGGGSDTFIGGAGADSHDGGLGFDTVDYRGATSRVVFNATTSGTLGDAAGDTYTGIERYYGSDFNDSMTGTDANEFFYGEDGNDVINAGGGIDRLYGGDGNDVQRGQDGNDQLYGSAGSDQLNGGTGFDIANYSLASAAVTVNLATGGTGGDAAGDTYFGIEAVYGSDFNDVMTGNSSANELRGGDGDDIINGGLGNDRLHGEAGADSFDGGGGVDAVYYSTASAGVELNLITGGTAGDASGDSFSSIEWVFGSAFDDIITGDAANNRLVGADGNDTLDGGDGNDRLLGGDGNDTLIGGAGVDTIFGQDGDDAMFGGDNNDFFFGGAGADSHDGGAGTDTVSYLGSSSGVTVNMQTGGTGGDAAGDTYVNVERIFGSGSDDSLTGSDGNDTLLGNGGADYLAGGLGNDSLNGGAGVDSFGYDTTQDGGDVINGFTTNEVIFILGSDPNFDSFAEVQAVGTDSGANVIFNFGGGNTLTIVGQNLADLDASNFDFTLAAEGLTDKDADAFASELPEEVSDMQDDAMAIFDMDALI